MPTRKQRERTMNALTGMRRGDGEELLMPKVTKRTEDEIRDHLADNLDLIEPGLTLIAKEVMLRNDKGASGFLDIFALTANGKLLIIEVKRSDAAAREAVQELVKYSALLKQNMLVKATEVRLIVASTEWRDLLVPFSEFVRSAPYDCSGIRLVVGNNGLTKTAQVVELSPEERPRRLSRRHFIWGFDGEAKARSAIPLIAAHMRRVGLKDFVIVLLAINIPGNETSRFLYFAQQELSLDAYLSLIEARLSDDDLDEFQRWLDTLTEIEDKISEAADKVWEDDGELYGKLKPINCQIAYPEKARSWFAPATLVDSEIFRFGRFESNHITDELIKADLLGEDGTSFHHANISADLTSKTEISALLATADQLFFLNPVWRTAIHDLCSYATQTGAISVSFRAFSNDDILRTVGGIAIGQSGFVPCFDFNIVRANKIERVVGTIEWGGRQPTFDEILRKYFKGDTFQYFMYSHFGDQRQLNDDLMSEMGLTYSLARVGANGPIAVCIRTSSIEDAKGGERKFLSEFTNANLEFCRSVVDLFLKHDQKFGQLYEQATADYIERSLEEISNAADRARGIYWSDKLDKCDLCRRDMSEARFMIDGAIGSGGPWACMCATCFGATGSNIGWGSGQLYERDSRGWRLVGGGCTTEDE